MWRGGSSKKSKPGTDQEAAAGSSRPYYECTFCKHGFTTAQALGGHMNIHRRDRAGRRPGRDAPAAGTAAAAYPPATATSFATYYAAPSAAAEAMSQKELNLFGAAAATHDRDLRLGLGTGAPEEWDERPAGDAERSLDLELRLGRHPGWQ